MITCDICGASFKTTQGLAGHKRIRHASQQAGFTLSGQQLHHKVFQHLANKVADRLADAILEEHGKQLIESYIEELSRLGLSFYPLGKKQQIDKAIILAAGCSSRLFPLNSDKPDCLLDVGGRPILRRQLDILENCGITHIALVRGYQKEKLDYPYISYYENNDYATSGILKSLFCAEKEINGEFVLSYGDIIYGIDILEKLLRDKADISLVIDTDWLSHYHQRFQHPVEEAGLVIVEGNRITRIGRNIIDPGEAYGEFIGLAKFSHRGAEILRSNYAMVISKYGESPFHSAPSVEKAYFSDMIQELIEQGYVVHNVDIKGGWDEIDTLEDLERAESLAWLN